MPKPSSSVLQYELLAFLRTILSTSLISTRVLQVLYLRSARLVSKRSQKFLLTAIPAVRRQLRWAMLFALLRAYISFMRRVIMDPRSGFEKSINRNGGWLLLVALRERIKARMKKRAEADFVTPPTSPTMSISSGRSFGEK
jgi:4-alpha-glucanotransferase